jgi:hypothetical protein
MAARAVRTQPGTEQAEVCVTAAVATILLNHSTAPAKTMFAIFFSESSGFPVQSAAKSHDLPVKPGFFPSTAAESPSPRPIFRSGSRGFLKRRPAAFPDRKPLSSLQLFSPLQSSPSTWSWTCPF